MGLRHPVSIYITFTYHIYISHLHIWCHQPPKHTTSVYVHHIYIFGVSSRLSTTSAAKYVHIDTKDHDVKYVHT